jgi:DNA topoisomerase-1
MIDNLVIVESPAKAKTIEKFLGKEFRVVSSFGHIRDLAKKNGINVEKDFAPDYEIPKEKAKVVSELRKAAAEAKEIWIASDEDREGEAIAWHLATVLKLDLATTKRIVFHEITKEAITDAIKHPRSIDMNLVNSQQARRILDRLVGFEISPVLWKKVQPSLSAGRVQSVAVRLIVEREREIISFNSESSFRVTGEFAKEAGDKDKKSIIKAEATKRFPNDNDARKFLELCCNALYTVGGVTVKPGTRSPAPPFTTSTLQQEAYRKLGFSVSQTMAVAQKLYEAGKITYMRTDSTNLSKLALAKSREIIISEFGEKYSKTRQFKTRSKGAQEAHEAIRPAYPDNESVAGSNNEKKLYELIWKRTIASQMADAEIEKTTITVDMNNSSVQFSATGEVIKFDGFLKVYMESTDQETGDDERYVIPAVKKGMPLYYNCITATQKFTTPPPRYTEASLVKKLEELGIGRPSTYAPTISTIQNRGYVSREDRPGEKRQIKILNLENGKVSAASKQEIAGKEKSKLFPQDIGMIVNDFLVDNFSDIVDYNFTAEVEEQFDLIAMGDLKWTGMLHKFYGPFHKTIENTLEKTDRKKGTRELGNHPETGEPVSVRMGRFGPVAQIGNSDDGNKPRFASLSKSQLLETITLDEALNLFRLPRSLGMHEGEDMVVGVGKFGPYIRYKSKFFSLKKDTDDPYSVTMERALEIISEKNESEKNKIIKDFGEIMVLNGRYGPYLTKDKQNFRLPKGTNAQKLTKEECIKIIDKSDKTKKSS